MALFTYLVMAHESETSFICVFMYLMYLYSNLRGLFSVNSFLKLVAIINSKLIPNWLLEVFTFHYSSHTIHTMQPVINSFGTWTAYHLGKRAGPLSTARWVCLGVYENELCRWLDCGLEWWTASTELISGDGPLKLLRILVGWAYGHQKWVGLNWHPRCMVENGRRGNW